jgi:hypothetical protein
LTADQIEVIRGPATLRFGSQAIGGVVEATNNPIPTFIPSRGVERRAFAPKDGVIWPLIFRLLAHSESFVFNFPVVGTFGQADRILKQQLTY